MEQFRDLKLRLPSNLKSLISGIMLEANNFYDMAVDGLSPLPNAPQGGDQMIRLYLEQLLIQLYRSRTAHTIAPKPQDLLGEMILYLNSRIYGTLSLPELCEQMHYGKTYLSRHFKDETGKSIMQYYRTLKIKEAKRILREQPLTVAEISALLCFDTPQYFSRIFKAETGKTPGEYREGVQV